MALPWLVLVLVHGGAHAADCWELTVAELARRETELRVLAVDLPGRGNRPADLTTVTIAGWVNSAVADIDDAGLGGVVVVGHSMAGLTVPGIVAKLGAPRVREMILLWHSYRRRAGRLSTRCADRWLRWRDLPGGSKGSHSQYLPLWRGMPSATA